MFVVREVVACLFVLVWLFLLMVDVITEGYRVPFWLNCVGVGTLAYALGINAADLTATRLPTRLSRT